MAYKVKITAITQNLEKITINYQILGHADQIIADAQTLSLNGSEKFSLTEVKGNLLEKARRMQNAESVVVSMQTFVGQSITVD